MFCICLNFTVIQKQYISSHRRSEDFYYDVKRIERFSELLSLHRKVSLSVCAKIAFWKKWLMGKTVSGILFHSTSMKYGLASGQLKYSKCPLRGNVDLFYMRLKEKEPIWIIWKIQQPKKHINASQQYVVIIIIIIYFFMERPLKGNLLFTWVVLKCRMHSKDWRLNFRCS